MKLANTFLWITQFVIYKNYLNIWTLQRMIQIAPVFIQVSTVGADSLLGGSPNPHNCLYLFVFSALDLAKVRVQPWLWNVGQGSQGNTSF